MCLAEQSARDAALAELARLEPDALDAAALMGQITNLVHQAGRIQGGRVEAGQLGQRRVPGRLLC